MISTLQGLSTVLATIAFTVVIIKIVVEPETKHRQIKILKNILIAFILIILTLSIIEIPQYYYGSQVGIVEGGNADLTFADIKDKDCQNRETVNIDGKIYVVTDTDKKIASLKENEPFEQAFGIYIGAKTLENVSFLRLFNECQGLFKGYYAEIHYYRDSDGYIFPVSMTYNEYMAKKGML